MDEAMLKKTISLSIAALALLSVTASADGEHHTYITVKNSTNDRLDVLTFNGTDSVCSSPHKQKAVDRGKSKVFKCHGKGKNRCKVTIKNHGTYYQECDAVKDKKTLTCSGRTVISCSTDD